MTHTIQTICMYPITRKQRDDMIERLTNDITSTDDELITYFINTLHVDDYNAIEYVKMRDCYMNNL